VRLTFQSVIEEIVCGELAAIQEPALPAVCAAPGTWPAFPPEQTGIRRDESEEASLSMGQLPQVVSRQEWLAARKRLLAEEKELTRARDRVNADRVACRWFGWTSRTRSKARRQVSDAQLAHLEQAHHGAGQRLVSAMPPPALILMVREAVGSLATPFRCTWPAGASSWSR
jgi:Bacterial protein of unknown function (DUF899)